MTRAPIRRILFVCSGNTCRSPMAEGIFRAEAAKRGLDIIVASAGTGAERVVARDAVMAARELGADIATHKPQQLTSELAAQYDLILTMTRAHLDAVPATARARAFTLHEYAHDGKQNVKDPVSQGPDVYRETAREIRDAILKILDEIEKA